MKVRDLLLVNGWAGLLISSLDQVIFITTVTDGSDMRHYC